MGVGGTPVIWLLRIYWPQADQSERSGWFFSQDGVEEDPVLDGEPIRHLPTLSVSNYAEAISWETSGIGTASASVSVLTEQDIPNLHFRQGQRLDGARAELSLWTPGTSYRARLVRLRGDFIPSNIPLFGAPLEGDITQQLLEVAANYPPDGASFTTDTWPDLPSASSEGSDADATPYPVWLGAGGDFTSSDGTAKQRSCIQAILVDDAPDKILISYGHVLASTVDVWSTENATTETIAVDLGYDGSGNPVSTCALAGTAWTWATTAADDTFYVVSITEGLRSLRGTHAVQGLGDAILFLLLQRYDPDRAGDIIDIAAWDALREKIDGIRVGVLVDSSGDPLDFIVSTLLPLVPGLYIVPGPFGIRPAYLEDVDPELCPLLIARDGDQRGPDLFREDDAEPEFLNNDVANRVVIRFARRVASGKYQTAVIVGRERDAFAAASQTRHGTKTKTIDSAVLWDRGSAWSVASRRLRFSVNAPTSDEWFAPLDVGGRLYAGQRIRVQDDDAAYDARPMSVAGIEMTDDGSGFLVTCIDW